MGISRSLLGCPSQITDARNYPSRKEERRRRIRQDRVWQKKFCVARRENPFFGDEESNSFCMMVFPPPLQKKRGRTKEIVTISNSFSPRPYVEKKFFSVPIVVRCSVPVHGTQFLIGNLIPRSAAEEKGGRRAIFRAFSAFRASHNSRARRERRHGGGAAGPESNIRNSSKGEKGKSAISFGAISRERNVCEINKAEGGKGARFERFPMGEFDYFRRNETWAFAQKRKKLFGNMDRRPPPKKNLLSLPTSQAAPIFRRRREPKNRGEGVGEKEEKGGGGGDAAWRNVLQAKKEGGSLPSSSSRLRDGASRDPKRRGEIGAKAPPLQAEAEALVTALLLLLLAKKDGGGWSQRRTGLMECRHGIG